MRQRVDWRQSPDYESLGKTTARCKVDRFLAPVTRVCELLLPWKGVTQIISCSDADTIEQRLRQAQGVLHLLQGR